MRYVATVPGFVAWIEFTDVWSRADLRRVFQTDDQDFIDFLASKTAACYIETTEGEPIATPADLSVMDNYDRLDLRVVEFLSQSLVTAAGEAVKGARGGLFLAPSLPASESQPDTASTAIET